MNTMLIHILGNQLPTGISITVFAEMTASVVHPDILANHATANLPLSFVF